MIEQGVAGGGHLHAAPAHAGLPLEAASRARMSWSKSPRLDAGDCDAMIDAAQRGCVKLGVVSQRPLLQPFSVSRGDRPVRSRPVLARSSCTLARRGVLPPDPWRGQWSARAARAVNQGAQLDCCSGYGPIDEVFGYWTTHQPTIEVEDTAVAVLRFKGGGVGSIVVSNSQKPGIYGKVHIHGSNGASVGVQTEGGAMFIAGMTAIQEPPYNDLWTVPGEEALLDQWRAADRAAFDAPDPALRYLTLQNQDFLEAILGDRDPAVTGRDGRVTVEIFTAIYRSQRDRAPVKFPVPAEVGAEAFDGRLTRR